MKLEWPTHPGLPGTVPLLKQRLLCPKSPPPQPHASPQQIPPQLATPNIHDFGRWLGVSPGEGNLGRCQEGHEGCDGKGWWIFSRNKLKMESSLLMSVYFCTRKTNNRLIHSIRGKKHMTFVSGKWEGRRKIHSHIREQWTLFFFFGEVANSRQLTKKEGRCSALGQLAFIKEGKPSCLWILWKTGRLPVTTRHRQSVIFAISIIAQLRCICTISFIRTSQ